MIDLYQTVLEVEWPCEELPAQLPPGCPSESEAMSNGWRKWRSGPVEGAAAEEGEEGEDEDSAVDTADWTPAVGDYDTPPAAGGRHSSRLAWLCRGIEARGPVASRAGPIESIGLLAQRVGRLLSGAGAEAQPSREPPAPSVPRLRMTFCQIPAQLPRPDVPAACDMPEPGLYCGDYGVSYRPYNVEVVMLTFEPDEAPHQPPAPDGWLVGRKMTGDGQAQALLLALAPSGFSQRSKVSAAAYSVRLHGRDHLPRPGLRGHLEYV